MTGSISTHWAVQHGSYRPGGLTADKKAVKVSSEVSEKFVGEYASKSGFRCAITKQKDQLFLKFGAQPPIELHAESETDFYMTVLNAEIMFNRTENGQVKSLSLSQDGKTTVAERKP